eukprot:jgi/Botrbrau1/11268/Bobra.0038s0039.1
MRHATIAYRHIACNEEAIVHFLFWEYSCSASCVRTRPAVRQVRSPARRRTSFAEMARGLMASRGAALGCVVLLAIVSNSGAEYQGYYSRKLTQESPPVVIVTSPPPPFPPPPPPPPPTPHHLHSTASASSSAQSTLSVQAILILPRTFFYGIQLTINAVAHLVQRLVHNWRRHPR